MRIVIDARMMGPRWTGIGLYTRKLIENLQATDATNEYLVLVDKDQFGSWNPTTNFKKVLAEQRVYGLGEQLTLPSLINKLKPDLVHFLHFNASIFYSGPRVVTIHDTTLIDYNVSPDGLVPNLKYGLKRIGMIVAFRHAASANRVIVPSQATADRLIERFGNKLKPRIAVTPEAADIDPRPAHDLNLNPPTLLYVGNFYPYKNVSILLQALSGVVKKFPDVKLTIVGNTPRFNESLRRQAKSLAIDRNVNFTGFLTDEELDQTYQTASLFVFPSLSEGFGLPPLEAMARGVPVLAARATCLPEVLGDAAAYFDPHDANELANKIIDLLAQPKALNDLQKRGFDQLKKYSWRRMAEQTLEVYRSVK